MYFGTVTQPAAWHSDPSKEWIVVQVKRVMFNSDFYALNKTMEMTFFFAVNLATEKVKNWNLSMEDFKHLKDARVNSVWKWKYFINPFYLIYLRNVVTYDIPISLSYDWD